MTVASFTGFETGDGKELNFLAASASVVTSPVRSGAYALKAELTTSTTVVVTGAILSSHRFYFRFPVLPAGNTQFAYPQKASSIPIVNIVLLTSGKVRVADAVGIGMSATDSTKTLAADTWYRIEFAIDLAAGGAVKLWIDGSLEINTTHSTDATAHLAVNLGMKGAATPNEYFFDDVRMDTGTLTPPGEGRCIARQGKAGTSTYDAWTKNGAATAALCWSDTPLATGTNCSSSTSAAAQTMLVAPFSQVQSGHGSEVVSPIDVIGACKTAVIAKRATSGNPSIRRRIGGADTDAAVAVGAADGYFDDGVFTTTPANLDTAEIGMVKAADTNLTTVEDAWLMVDYQPVWFPHRGDLCFEEPIIRPRVEMVAY